MDEINDIGNVIANIIDNKGEDKRNFFGILRAQRGATDLYNISGDSLNLLNEAYKSNKIGADEYKEGLRNIIEATGNDLGLNVSLVYLDTSTMPKDSERSTGSSYIVDRKNRKVLIPIDVKKIKDTGDLFGTIAEEVSHGKDALEGRQDKKVAEDETNKEKGLESLGRPANDYVKNKLGDKSSNIQLTTDGIDLTNADVGEKVGDKSNEGYKLFRYDLRLGINEDSIGTRDLKFTDKPYTEKEIQDTIDKTYGKGHYKIDWNKYTKDAEYREQTNYYFYQAKFFVKVKSIDKIDKGYIEITKDDGKKLKLTEIKDEEAIFHNVKKINGEWYFIFGEKTRYKKYVNEDGYELILDQNYKPVYDPVIVGTYNFHTYKSIAKNPIDFASHVKDVNLWKKYGTGPNDPTTREDREKIGDLKLGLRIQDSYNEIAKKLNSQKRKIISYSELQKMLDEIETEKVLKKVKEIEEY